jgi:hypothetical protein
VEDTLKLTDWDAARRVVILRRQMKADIALSRKVDASTDADGGLLGKSGEQIELLMPDPDVKAWEYAALVTNSEYRLEAIAQLYRDRADAENGFDELKNQWGWVAKPGARMEAITSRTLLLAGVGRAVKHGNQTTLYLTPMHAARDKLMAMVNNIRAALAHIKRVAEQLPNLDRWNTFLTYLIRRIYISTPPLLLHYHAEGFS